MAERGCFFKCYCCDGVYGQGKLTQIRIYVDDSLEQSLDACYCDVCRWCPLRDKCDRTECGFIHSDSEHAARPAGLTPAVVSEVVNRASTPPAVTCSHKQATYRVECPNGAVAAYRAMCQPNCQTCSLAGSRCTLCNRNTLCEHQKFQDTHVGTQTFRTCTSCSYSGFVE
jgi:hypothetical protein